MKDLFNHPEEHTPELKAIFYNWQDRLNNGLDYNQCDELLKEVKAVGFTFEYELSAEPFNLQKLITNDVLSPETTALHRRFKILYLLCSQIGVLENKLAELADRIDDQDPQAEEALTFYEDQVIKALEA